MEENLRQKVWNLCRNGSFEYLTAFLQEEAIPFWRKTYANKCKKKLKRRADEPESENTGDGFDFLKRQKVLESSAIAPPDKVVSSSKAELPAFEQSIQPVPVDAAQESEDESNSSELSASESPSDGNLKKAAKPCSKPSSFIELYQTADTQEVDFLRKRLRDLMRSQDKNKRCSLHLAAYHGTSDILKQLVRTLDDDQALVPVSTPAKDQMQAIHFAASNGKLNTLSDCIKAGARVNAIYGKQGKTALDLAENHNHKEIVDFLLTKSGRRTQDTALMGKDETFSHAMAALDRASAKADGLTIPLSQEENNEAKHNETSN